MNIAWLCVKTKNSVQTNWVKVEVIFGSWKCILLPKYRKQFTTAGCRSWCSFNECITSNFTLSKVFLQYSRSSRPEVFCRKGVFENFANFKGKHLCQSLFFNKVATLRPATLLKKRPMHRCFPVNFDKFLITLFVRSNSCGCFRYSNRFKPEQYIYWTISPLAVTPQPNLVMHSDVRLSLDPNCHH